ncbi:hypothetical protein [Paenibacillus glycanilyticus]|uniref:Uncharacterized protein n=1 Tax=Paenibacillus glycanilyticus TaxID=126569 RepID=A0ABQ6GFF7_9BACL|nr:hypothetical protein [Paenibacillus glycanilyticus]GLX69629.1 hypothetical protein MU1_39740 [Paenibacillus glycanilyticus]
MQLDWHYSWNVVDAAAGLLGWLVVLGLVIFQRQKQETRRPIWKILLVTLAGFFSLSFKIPLFGQIVNIALLPLGLWIAYLLLRKRSWTDYRKFAWIGFAANYVLLVTTLLAGPIYGSLFDRNDPSTYLAHLEKAKLVAIHPSAGEATFEKKLFSSTLAEVKASDMAGTLDWYRESLLEDGTQYQQERFPYALVGAEARWGSGLHASAYLEADGKGLLLATKDRYYYYRSEEPMLRMEVRE